jgi:hypothetical protein
MSKLQSAYDLFGPTSLLNLERTIAAGRNLTAAELATVLEANSGEPLPQWSLATVVSGLRGELKKKRGRPKESSLSGIRFEIAKAQYPLYLAWLIKREGSSGLKGWSAIRGKDWWTGPPHEQRRPNCHSTLAQADELASIFEPALFIIIGTNLS